MSKAEKEQAILQGVKKSRRIQDKEDVGPMKYIGGRFSQERYQKRFKENRPKGDESDLYEVDKEYLRKLQAAKDYSNINIDQLLLEEGINYNSPNPEVKWLPLYYYDNKTFDQFTNEARMSQTMVINENGETVEQAIKARALHRNAQTQQFSYQKCIVHSYDAETERFLIEFLCDSSKTQIPRIHICFDLENPRKYVKRVADAHQRRNYANSLIKYNFYIKNMPHENDEIKIETAKKLEKLAINSKRLVGLDTTSLLLEVNTDFADTMNKIIFDKYLSESNDLLPHGLSLPPKEQSEIPYFGMLELESKKGAKEIYMFNHNEVFTVEPKDFTELFKSFCINSLLNKDEVVRAFQLIRQECNVVNANQLFELNYDKSYKLQEFKNLQEQYSINQLNYLKHKWVQDITNIIKVQFQDIDKGWFNIKDEKGSNKETYEAGKLKRFLNLVKIQMQDTLYSLTYKSYNDFVSTFEKYVPKKVIINGANDIKNIYDENDESIQMPPLFSIDLNKVEAEFIFSINLDEFVQTIMSLFDSVLDEIRHVPDIEAKILAEVFKQPQRQEYYLKVPERPLEKRLQKLNETPEERYSNQNQWLVDLFEKLKTIVSDSIAPLKEFKNQFDPFKEILQLQPHEIGRQYIKDIATADVNEIKARIYETMEKEELLKSQIQRQVQVSFFQINLSETMDFMLKKYSDLIRNLKQVIEVVAVEQTTNILEQFLVMQDKIKQNPDNIEKLTEIKDYMAQVPNELDKMKDDINNNMKVYDILDEFQKKLDDPEKLNNKWIMYLGPKDILEQIEKRKETLDKEKNKFQDRMRAEQEEFKERIESIQKTISNFSTHRNMNAHVDIAKQVEAVNFELKDMQDKAKKYNQRESLFEMENTDYSIINQMVKEFTPYSNLWLTTTNWFKNVEIWKNEQFEKLDANAAEKFVEEGMRTLAQTVKFFKDRELPHILRIAETVKEQVDAYRPKIPLMVALRKQGMVERHWKEISDTVGFEVQPSENFTFTHILDMGLLQYVEKCVEVGEKASKEYQIETMLKTMQAQWKDITFKVSPYKNSGIIKGYDEIQVVLDEHIVNTQTMHFSTFKKPFEEDINNWYELLKLTSDVLEEWAKCQVQWMYLCPIFDSADIAKQLPGETKKFKQVDQIWKQSINDAKKLQNVLAVCQTEGLLKKLQDANANLEIIQKELSMYLEKKREGFARFYFLSDDELLEILSQTKEPTAVQPHLKKVFENIFEVEFDEHKKIIAMFSGEKEKINLVTKVDPIGKNVEDWMGELEQQMVVSVRNELFKSVENYTQMKRTHWVVSHPGQCVLNGSQVMWTSEVETAFKDGVKGIKQYWTDVLKTQLYDLVELVRTKLSKQAMITVNALIVIDVHAKDVIEVLWQNEIDSPLAFEWNGQLRYYLESKPNNPEENCYVKCIQTDFPYGYEYLGNTLRLVITPLTDKCFMTLMGALNLNLGGAPAGPAGTGKTESTKDLAKALAKQCVVFNCQESMDYQMVGKFFKGLASAGAWCCFDEFNRINVEVLSVIAQQLQVLFSAKAIGKERETFEGSEIRILPTFCVFITMNPGYAGRTELPDNLKALFRGVAMMVPDYALIGEIMLYSFGFQSGKILAKKMVTTFKLASEQLSSQHHYDYGMRAVRSVINAAGLLKQADPDQNEYLLLLKALRDVNVPKFLAHDLPLFENIIKDLFPGMKLPEANTADLKKAMNDACVKYNLQPTEAFIDKVFQLYDTIQVRHGLMLVGPTGGGKTSNYLVLQHAMSQLAQQGKPDAHKVNIQILNPKSITMDQLYGAFSESTHEWTDGIIADIIRETVRDTSGEKHWIMFDGPVDALWIESMNTVLDDNKKLCLSSGQILSLTPQMTMMFEPEDLEVASPATVSRCGMVYMEPATLGNKPLAQSWLNTLPPKFKEKKTFIPFLQQMIDIYMESSLEFMRGNCKEVIKTVDNNVVQSLFRILTCYFNEFRDKEGKHITPEQIDNLESVLEPLFLFATTWSIGATCDYDGRIKFDRFLKDLHSQNKKSNFTFPEEDLIYDYQFDIQSKQYVQWKDTVKEFVIQQGTQYNEIMVPTSDSTRNLYLMKLLISNKMHVVCPGPTGTGKSQNAYELLTNQMGEDYQYIVITFSAQTSANQTQDTIDSKMEKRRKGIFGPPIGKRCIVFVDDLNMPKKETYGAQPPIEILRQYLCQNGWYNRKDLKFINLEDLILFSAMGPPGGGRSVVTARMIRHFNVLAYTELSQSIIKQIFSTLTKFFLGRFNEDIINIIPKVVDAVLVIYDRTRNELLPTPSKSHYTFNLRDISRVFQGICGISQKFCTDKAKLITCWYHENMRVYHDRLTTVDDRQFFINLLIEQFPFFELTKEEVLNSERIIFGDYFDGIDVEPRQYRQIQDMSSLLQKMESYQEEYNINASYTAGKQQLKLVLFLDACEHISRISRIIRQPGGNALCLGVGGSGRQSLSKMANFIAGYKIFQIEVTKNYNMKTWREDIRTVLMDAGINNKPITFLFSDAQIILEQQVEDINNILNSGDVTNLYGDKEMEEIINNCKNDCLKKGLQPNKMNIFTQYLSRVKKNIHIILAFSPISELFRTRLRMFPSLVNCMTLDWFTEWPEEALLGVGREQIIEDAQVLGIEEDLPKLCEMFKTIHKSVEKYSIKYQNDLRRHVYVTPTSFLSQLNSYKSILKQKQTELKRAIFRMKSGLDKLNEANVEVEKMKIELTEKQPKLAEAQIETEKLMARLTVDKKNAEETQVNVQKEEEIATQEANKANEIKKHCEESVEEANKNLEECLKEVDKLKKAHLDEIKALPKPPLPINVVLTGLVILNKDYIKSLGGDVIKVNDPDPKNIGKKIEDFFQTAKKYLLNDPNTLITKLKTYDKENINNAYIIELEKKVIPDPDFNKARIQGVSQPCGYLFSWIKAMYDFHKVFEQTQPLRDKLAESQKIVDAKTKELNEKKAALDAINKQIADLQQLFDEKVAFQNQLTADINECQVKLDRAQLLTASLSDEKIRWGYTIDSLIEAGTLLAGDSVISAGYVSYSGPFTSDFRSMLQQEWLKQLQDLGIKHTPNTNLKDFMGQPVVIQNWNINGLPKDDTSIENGIIIEYSKKFPLMIDPQNQANKFIRNMGKERAEGIEVMKATDSNIMRTIEKAIQFGQWVLIENVGTELDPAIDPILNQNLIKQGSSYFLQLGDKQLSYDPKFKFFMTSTNPNPHYSPETQVKITLINFAITSLGLEEQMLAQIVALENPQLQQKKTEIVRRNAQDKAELLKIEDSILKSLSEITDINEMLMDESLIIQLQDSKKFANEINQRVEDSKVTEKQIDETRESYRPVAFRASLLFFSIIDLSTIDPMYQYSLQWFTNLFIQSVENSPASNVLETRLQNLNSYLTQQLYQNVCRSLFEKHKLTFSFILCVKILQSQNDMDDNEWRTFLVGPTGDIQVKENPSTWISHNSWPTIYKEIYTIARLQPFAKLEEHFITKIDEFKHIYDSQNAHEEVLPAPWNECLNDFQKLMVLKCIRPDKVVNGVMNWISLKIGREFIIPPTFDLAKCYKDSQRYTPLIFVLSSGSDPVSDFLKFADEMGMLNKYRTISLGQGQGKKAERMIKEEQQKGGWVLLQNCHLAISWMSELSRLCEELNDQIHPDFRLWLTSMPSDKFPISVLQNGVKMTLEPPKGLRANLLRSYANLTDQELNNCQKPEEYKKLLFGLCLFHAIIQDRRKFGAIGWNIPYEFTMEDLVVCRRQLKLFLDTQETIPYKVIQFLVSEINYGGRVTDDKDRTLINTTIRNFICDAALSDEYNFSKSGVYHQIPALDQMDYIKYIESLPINPEPEAFGLHANADITNSQNETRDLLETILSIQPRQSSGSGKTREQQISEIAEFILRKTPKQFDVYKIQKDYPTKYEESMNTFLIQELTKYNALLSVMQSSLINVQKALVGQIAMSEELEKLANNLFENQVPQLYEQKKVAFLTLKPLGSWIEDLNKRYDFMQGWVLHGTPNHYWISGFFFPQAFLTGTLQNYARKYQIPIDELDFQYIVKDDIEPKDIKQKPEDGCYIHGMFLEGARWDFQTHFLTESKPKELFSDMPVIQLLPVRNRVKPKTGVYNCPLYKTVQRAGTLSTTGHSTNFVLFLELPSQESEDVWIKAGVASFLALRY